MPSRYDNREVALNQTEQYRELFNDRGREKIRQYFTPELHHPTAEETARLEIVAVEWKLGSAYYKLADAHYGDPTKWWVIAWFNQKPTDAHVKMGDLVEVPKPLNEVLRVLRV